jgi:DNA-binding transcriptional regulator YiaG
LATKAPKSRKTWSERVKALLAVQGGSLETLATKLGVSFFTVLRWRNGEVKPSRMGQKLVEKMEAEVKG